MLSLGLSVLPALAPVLAKLIGWISAHLPGDDCEDFSDLLTVVQRVCRARLQGGQGVLPQQQNSLHLALRRTKSEPEDLNEF